MMTMTMFMMMIGSKKDKEWTPDQLQMADLGWICCRSRRRQKLENSPCNKYDEKVDPNYLVILG